MDWNQIAEGLKRLTRTIVPARSAEPGRVPDGDRAMGGTASYDDQQNKAQMTPYPPQDREERSTFSLHIGC